MKHPKLATLKKYGLSVEEWELIYNLQAGKCPICTKVLTSTKTAIDHEHVKGWKSLKPELRKLHVRGLVCTMPCNRRILDRNMNLDRAKNCVEYLQLIPSGKRVSVLDATQKHDLKVFLGLEQTPIEFTPQDIEEAQRQFRAQLQNANWKPS